jgi:hypothetical protein
LWLQALFDLARVQLHRKTTHAFSNDLRHIGAPHFLSGNPVISLMNLQKSPKKERQDSYPENDANEDAPIDCLA